MLLWTLISVLSTGIERARASAHSAADITTITSSSTEAIQSIVDEIESWKGDQKKTKKFDLPFVTLTYAQSIDGNIGLVIRSDKQQGTAETSENFPLSDSESLRMTHALRSIHDVILVGGRTLAVDNPRLNNRLWWTTKEEDSKQSQPQPRPVVLDTHLKYVKRLGRSWRARNVIVCCSEEAIQKATEDRNKGIFPSDLEFMGCNKDPKTGSLDLKDVLQKLKSRYGFQSVMVEGGASILRGFYREQELVDCLCITIAPKLLLWKGLPAIQSNNGGEEPEQEGPSTLIDDHKIASSKFLPLGKDVIFICRLIV